MKKYNNCQEIIDYFKECQKNRISNTFDITNSISSALSMNFYNEYIISYNESLNLLINNENEINKEIEIANYSKDNNAIFTENYYIDLSSLSAIKFKEITKIKKKIKYSNLIFNKGLKSYIYCYKYKIGIIIHNDELFTTIKNQTPFEIINNKIKSK